MKIHLPLALVAGFLATPSLAVDASDAMGGFLDDNIVGWASDAMILDAIRAQNAETAGLTQAEIDAMDARWRAEVGTGATPTIDGVLKNPVSDMLRGHVDAMAGKVTEIFVMDARGLNVASSAVTSDYWQGDEEKFSATAGVGPDARHFSEIEKDESTGSYQGQASFAITDPDTGAVIGAMTVGINAESLF